MLKLDEIILVLWLPVVFFIFERLPIRKAIVFSFISAWLFLPTTEIPLSGIPDWTKMTATVVSVLLCTGMKNVDSLLRIKPSWLDLPVVVYCLCPIVSAVYAGGGAYDGFSSILDESFRWGLPYLIGRAFLGDVAGNRMLCYGVVLGGIIYIPVCLLEIRFSPFLKLAIYGIMSNPTAFDLRYGGYRPMGFLTNGLELGWWMCCATFSAYMLWRSGAVRRVQGYPLGAIFVVLALVTVACKSTGAMIQLTMGFAVVHLAKATKSALVLWAILLIPPTYCFTRSTGLWTGESLVGYAYTYFGPERAQSLGFRFDQEEGLLRFAVQRPILGFGRTGGFNAPDKFGQILITDGLWIIVFGTVGLVGLSMLLGMLLLPTIVFMRKFKTDQWFHPDVAPVTSIVVLLPLYMIDNLSNAMLNPIYAIAMGSASGYLAKFSAKSLGLDASPGAGRGRTGVGALPAHEDWAVGLSTAAGSALAAFESRRYPEAIRRLDDQIDEMHRAFRHRPMPDLLVELGRAHALRARCYARLHEPARSIEEREYLLGLWSRYAYLLAGDPLEYPEFAGNLNDLAWSLLTSRPHDAAAIDRAVGYAGRVVEAHPEVGAYWNTLGVARFRAGQYLAAIQALSRSVNLSPGHGSPYDFYYLALANHRLGYRKPAEAWMGRAEAACRDGDEEGPDLRSLKDEAAAEMFV